MIKLNFNWVYPIIATILVTVSSCNRTENPSITQEVNYVHNDYNYQIPVDTIEFIGGGLYIMHDEFTGYALETTSDDFQSLVMGDANYIDSIKCIEYDKIKEKQVELNKLRELKSCD